MLFGKVRTSFPSEPGLSELSFYSNADILTMIINITIIPSADFNAILKAKILYEALRQIRKG